MNSVYRHVSINTAHEHEGQSMNTFFRDNQIVPTLEELVSQVSLRYRLMIHLKTTTAFKLAYIPLKINCESGKKTYQLGFTLLISSRL